VLESPREYFERVALEQAATAAPVQAAGRSAQPEQSLGSSSADEVVPLNDARAYRIPDSQEA
jgi:hypothetical protein